MSRYMAFFPICPVCLEQHVYPADDTPVMPDPAEGGRI